MNSHSGPAIEPAEDEVEIYDESSQSIYVFANEAEADQYALTGEETWLSRRHVQPGEFETD